MSDIVNRKDPSRDDGFEHLRDLRRTLWVFEVELRSRMKDWTGSTSAIEVRMLLKLLQRLTHRTPGGNTFGYFVARYV